MTRRGRIGLVLAAAVTLALLPAVASAHPLGNFTINHYAGLVVGPGRIDVDLVLDMAEIPTLDERDVLDADHDGSVTPAETDAARGPRCAELIAQVVLTVDGRDAPLRLVAAGVELRPGAAGLDTLRIVCELRADTAVADGAAVTFMDGSYPDRLGWREIVMRGDHMTVGDADAAIDVTDRLTTYPTDLLQQPLDERSLAVVARFGGPGLTISPVQDATPLDEMPAESAGAAAVPDSAALPWSIELRDPSPLLLVLGVVLAALAGAGHALSPGHGKTIMAAYLVGTRGTARDAVVLGGAVTVSHTIGVLALAAFVLLAGDFLPPERLYPVLSVVSGITVLAIGAVLLVGCIRRFASEHDHDRDQGPDHGHSPAHDHSHPHPHPHARPAALGWRGLAAIGVAGGMVPSTAALVLLLGAISAGQPVFGVVLALAFGAGMAAVLTGLGLTIVRGRDRLEAIASRLPRASALRTAAPWVATSIVITSGVVLTARALA